MIKDKLININQYKINDAFEVFKTKISDTNDLLTIELPFKAIPIEYETKNFDLTKFENHRKYIDIHYIVSGNEVIGLTNIKNVEPTMNYDETGDYQLFQGEVEDTVELKEGDFLVLFEHELHVTGGVWDNQPNNVKKIVFKIPL